MANSLVGECWFIKITPTQRAVLLVLCDSAEDVPDNKGIGINAYPSIGRICWKTDLSRRTVIYTIKQLEKLKILERKRVHPIYSTTEYQINLGVAAKKARYHPAKPTGGGIKLPEK